MKIHQYLIRIGKEIFLWEIPVIITFLMLLSEACDNSQFSDRIEETGKLKVFYMAILPPLFHKFCPGTLQPKPQSTLNQAP